MVKQEGADFVIHYFDDLIVVGSLGLHNCTKALSTLLSVFNQLGFPMTLERLEDPQCQLIFLGFELESAALMIWVPPQQS